MLARRRHEEKTAEGEFIYVIETFELDKAKGSKELLLIDGKPVPVKFSGWRLKTPFHEGKARTKFREKAIRFDEEFNYVVSLHKEDTKWTLAGRDVKPEPEDLSESDIYVPQDEEAL